MQLSEAIDLFLGQYKTTTRRTYHDDMKAMLRYIAPGLEIETIKFVEVERAIQQYESRDTVSSVYTVNKLIRTIKRFFNWCVDVEIIDKSPAKNVIFRSEPNNDVLQRTMPDNVYNGLLEYYSLAAKLNPKRNMRFLALLHFLGTSARRRGCAYLKWSDINFAKREAMIYDKRDEYRIVFLSDECASVLQRWQLLQKNTEGEFVFTMKGGSINPDALGKFFRDWCHKAGFDKEGNRGWGIHSVRHNVGVALQDAGIPEIEAAGIMGHTVQTYRAYYATQDKTRLKNSASKLHKLRSNKRKSQSFLEILDDDEATG